MTMHALVDEAVFDRVLLFGSLPPAARISRLAGV
jgi:hypothetical protein